MIANSHPTETTSANLQFGGRRLNRLQHVRATWERSQSTGTWHTVTSCRYTSHSRDVTARGDNWAESREWRNCWSAASNATATNEWNSETTSGGGVSAVWSRVGACFQLNAKMSPMIDERSAYRRNDSVRPADSSRSPARSDRLASEPTHRQMSQTIATERRRGWTQINGLVRAGWRQAPDRYSAAPDVPIPAAQRLTIAKEWRWSAGPGCRGWWCKLGCGDIRFAHAIIVSDIAGEIVRARDQPHTRTRTHARASQCFAHAESP